MLLVFLRTWTAALSGKMNSTPHVPGYLPDPNSAPDWLTPNHLNFLAPGLLVEVEVGADDVEEDLVEVVMVVAAPGWHWLYQSFT
jgi:hypothetical protein